MNFAAIVARVLPGSFVPDMGSQAPTISPIPASPLAGTLVPGSTDKTGAVAGADGAPSFKDTVQAFLGDVNSKLQKSDQGSRDFATGKTNDLNTVVTSVEEANLALSYTMAIRTKLLDAYSEISRMSV